MHMYPLGDWFSSGLAWWSGAGVGGAAGVRASLSCCSSASLSRGGEKVCSLPLTLSYSPFWFSTWDAPLWSFQLHVGKATLHTKGEPAGQVQPMLIQKWECSSRKHRWPQPLSPRGIVRELQAGCRHDSTDVWGMWVALGLGLPVPGAGMPSTQRLGDWVWHRSYSLWLCPTLGPWHRFFCLGPCVRERKTLLCACAFPV